jgi:hypothetical protein
MKELIIENDNTEVDILRNFMIGHGLGYSGSA